MLLKTCLFLSNCAHFGVVLAVLGLAFQGAAAAPDKELEFAERRRADRDQIFLEQQLPAENLQRVAATPCVGGLAGVYPCHNIDLVTFMPLAQIGGGNGNDIWGWTDSQTGKEYAIMGRTSGTSFVDISDPANPIYLGNLPPHTSNSSWRDIKVHADHAYVVSEASLHGLQIFDLTQLRSVVSPPVTFSETNHYDGFGNAHNIAINEQTGFAYVVGTGTCSGGPHFLDLADPANPAYAGCHSEAIYTHDTQCVVYSGPDTTHQGSEVCFNSNTNKLNVIDVTDKANSTLISQTLYSGSSYTHQGWLTEDQHYFLLGDELDEQNFGHNTRTRIFDVTDLDAPQLVGFYDGPSTSIDHNLYTHQGYVYAANYREGLRILDPAGVASGTLTEVAYFDIYPSSDSANFNGAWSVYPFFDSGTVVVSGIEQGLFILRPVLAPDFDISSSDISFSVCDPATVGATIDLVDRNGYSGSVSLSASGLPLGATADFSHNPVVVPGASDLTLMTAGVPAGSYSVTITGDDGAATHDTTIQLGVSDAFPGPPTPSSPADGSLAVSRSPALSWSAGSQASGYVVEVAADSEFLSIVYSQPTIQTTHVVNQLLDALTPYYWRVRATNACGSGTESQVFGFTTLDTPPILLVDDDDNGPDVRAAYVDALTALGESFDVWDTGNSDDEPSAVTLSPYQAVIWFTGDEFGGAAGPGPGGESALASWLDSSGCLMVSAQDYFYDRGLTAFMQGHLGASAVTNDVNQTTAAGRGSLFGGLGPYSLSFPYSNYTDTVSPGLTAEPSFDGSQGIAGIDKDAGLYRTAYFGFGVETLSNAADREAVLSRFLGWCTELAELDGDADGTDNGTDCAPGDPGIWATPSAARDLFLTTASTDNVSWLAPNNPGSDSISYDLLRADDPDGFAAATCLESGETDRIASDALDPASGNGFYYLIRARNGCGESLGSGALPRSASTCP